MIDDKIVEKIIAGKGTVVIYIDESGEVIMLTTGDLTKNQLSTLSKIITIVDKHSIVLSLVLGIEMFFDNILYKIKKLFSR